MKVVDRTTRAWQDYVTAVDRAHAEHVLGHRPNPRHFEAAVRRATVAWFADDDSALVDEADEGGPGTP